MRGKRECGATETGQPMPHRTGGERLPVSIVGPNFTDANADKASVIPLSPERNCGPHPAGRIPDTVSFSNSGSNAAGG